MPFLHDCCSKGSACMALHVRRKKTSIEERHEKFGDVVLERVGQELQEKIAGRVLTPRNSEPDQDAVDPWATYTPSSFSHSSQSDDSDDEDSNPYLVCFAPDNLPPLVGWVLQTEE
eukprot:TRINITY_DN4942_c0_g1_i1.p2 TRINITY_DN4942_c0_g1~~TRINITY_DN4942_c0_g1_i1.p2  ORF type:complete len:116 (+),score=27.93 TRINITY_DN4942_c0_g1_i1:266-613(+)